MLHRNFILRIALLLQRQSCERQCAGASFIQLVFVRSSSRPSTDCGMARLRVVEPALAQLIFQQVRPMNGRGVSCRGGPRGTFNARFREFLLRALRAAPADVEIAFRVRAEVQHPGRVTPCVGGTRISWRQPAQWMTLAPPSPPDDKRGRIPVPGSMSGTSWLNSGNHFPPKRQEPVA